MTKNSTISIGNSPSNDVALDHESISSVHAYLKVVGPNSYELSDAGSTNGIFVNNRKVKRKIIDHKDQVVLGGLLVDMQAIIKQAEAKVISTKTDFTNEYRSLLQALSEYSRKKDKLSGNSMKGNIVRVGLSLAFISVLIFKPDLIPDPSTRYVLIMLMGLIPVFLGLFSSSGEKKRAKLDLLKLAYEDTLRCPKCNGSLLRYTPSYLKHKGKCPNEKCTAVYDINSN